MNKLTNIFDNSPLFQLKNNLRAVNEVYFAAVYGATYSEAQILQILKKTGLEKSSIKALEKDKFDEAIKTLNAVEKLSKNTIEIDFTDREIVHVRKALKSQLLLIRKIPLLAREQQLISYATLLENYISDVIKNYLELSPESLKSNKSTLKDSQLIDSIIEGNTLQKLIESRVRELMYDSITGWINFLRDKGFSITENDLIKEMFLIRNVLIHNNKTVGTELIKAISNKKYIIGKKINLSEKDNNRFKSALENLVNNIDAEYHRKTKNLNTRLT